MTDLRNQYARAIRDAVRVRLGTNALRLANEGRPVMLNMSEAEAAADAVLAIRDAARTASGQQPETKPCACTHPQDRHLSACTECPCIGYAPTWPPTKRRIVPVCDQCGAPWATSHRCATAPAVGQPAEAQATDEAHPPQEGWRVEVWDVDHWMPAGVSSRHREAGLNRLHVRRGANPDDTFRLVRETTTWTVEDETR